MIFADVTFFEFTPYFDKETSKSTSSELEDDFMFFLENSFSSNVNMDPMPQRYRKAYIRRANPLCQLACISNHWHDIGENTVISSLSIDIDSQSDLDISIAHRKRKKNCTLQSL